MLSKTDLIGQNTQNFTANLPSGIHTVLGLFTLSTQPSNFSGAASGLVDKVEAEAGKRILAKYPDINDVLELLKDRHPFS